MTISRPRNGGSLVVETLTALGTTTVFGIPGQHALGLFDALSDSDLEFVSSRVENNAAFSADGYARESGDVGVLFVSTGPGALTALAGLQEAYATAVPLVVISSQIPSSGLGGARKGMLHQLDNQQAAAGQVCKSTHLVRDAAHIPSAITAAWLEATTAPQGPTWVEIPQDVLLGETHLPRVTVDVPDPRHPAPRQEILDRAATMLSAAKRPAIVAGGGVRRSGAEVELLALAEVLGAPVVCSPGGHGAFPWDHPLSLQSWVEDRYVTELLEDADVLLVVGSALGEVTSNYFTFVPRGELIQIDAQLDVLGSNHPVLAVHSDASIALSGLVARVESLDGERGRSAARDVLARVNERLESQDLATEQKFLADLRSAVPDGMSTYWDMTIAAYWAWSAWDTRSGAFHSAQGAGGLGFGFPAALGAAAAGNRRVLAVSGDGGSMYGVAELASAVQHQLPVTWLIVDDGGYGILREYMNDTFGRATATELARPDFEALAAAFGVQANVATFDNVGDVLAKALDGKGPNVVIVRGHLSMFAPTHLD
ncbi:MAG: thiamine pyrophosphate-binding protein [Actinomycetota bacterium]|nr:thiamine pyrophosphate-binding protein [Actinomycetota bacterium]